MLRSWDFVCSCADLRLMPDVLQRFSGKDLQGKSQVAKAVYLAEIALMADSTANMNKLAQELQRSSGVPYEDLSSAAMNVSSCSPPPPPPPPPPTPLPSSPCYHPSFASPPNEVHLVLCGLIKANCVDEELLCRMKVQIN